MSTKKFLLISIFALIVVNAALYGKTLTHDFVNIDDLSYVASNPLIKNVDGAKLKRIFTAYYFANYQPLVLLSYALEFSLFGLNPAAYHATNFVLHIINSILVLLLLYMITENTWVSLILALIFSIHPMQVESVAWISERKGLMCASFYFLSFMSYIRFSRESKKGFYLLSLILFLFALLSKPMAVTFPIILLLYDYYKEDLSKAKVIEKLPFFLLTIIFSIITMAAQEKGGALVTSRLSNEFYYSFPFYTIGFYVAKLITPLSLSAYYGYPKELGYSSAPFIICILMILSLIIYAIKIKKVQRDVNFGILFFLVSIVPIIRFVPVGNTMAADRYMYMPIIGFFFALVMLCRRITINRPGTKKIFVAVFSVYLLLIGVKNFTQSSVWADTEKLWLDVLKTSPDYYNAYLGLGYYHLSRNENEQARKYYSKVLNNVSGREMALASIGLSYVNDQNVEGAKQYFTALLEEFPKGKKDNSAAAHMFLGDIATHYKDYDKAKSHYEKSLALKTVPLTLYKYASLMEKMGDKEGAIKNYKLAIEYGGKGWTDPVKALERLTAGD